MELIWLCKMARKHTVMNMGIRYSLSWTHLAPSIECDRQASQKQASTLLQSYKQPTKNVYDAAAVAGQFLGAMGLRIATFPFAVCWQVVLQLLLPMRAC